MKLLEVSSNANHLNKIKEIYYSSFPESERADFQDLVNHTFPNSKLFGVFEDENLIGFSFVSELGDFAYIVYLAIDDEFRNKNYGTIALKLISDLYSNKTKVLCVEKPNNVKDIQKRRIAFYKRNGFSLADFEFEYLGQKYYSMYNGKFDKQKFIEFLLVCFPGCKDFEQITLNDVKFEVLDKSNIEYAIKIQKDIFPLENGSEDLKETIDNKLPSHQFLQKYWLAKIDDKYVGICGLYAYNSAPKDAWLGWFGVVEDERGKGLATKILKFAMEQAKNLGFETFRLYTDEEDNSSAINLYNKFGMISEIYDNPEDLHFEISKTLIFSTSLTEKPTTLWNNKNLYLGAHDKKNEV